MCMYIHTIHIHMHARMHIPGAAFCVSSGDRDKAGEEDEEPVASRDLPAILGK